MSWPTAPDGLAERIRHAEGWLRRARVDCRRGHTDRALLRLLLAEAEIRRARESGESAVAAGGPIRRAPGGWALLAAAGIAALLMIVRLAVIYPIGTGQTDAKTHLRQAASTARAPEGIVQFESAKVLPFVGLLGGVPDRGAEPSASWGSPVHGLEPVDLLRSGDGGWVAPAPR
jgi:hypothetical protein